MDITRSSISKSDWLYSLQPKMVEVLYNQKIKKRPGAYCGWDHELLIAKIRFKLKKVGKTTRPFSSVQLLSRVQLFATPRVAAHQASLSITNSQSSSKLMCTESVMPSSHLILCHPLLLLLPIPPSIRVFSNESTHGWTWVWVNSGSWWWTGKPGVLQFMGLQRVRHDWATELNWTDGSILIPE